MGMDCGSDFDKGFLWSEPPRSHETVCGVVSPWASRPTTREFGTVYSVLVVLEATLGFIFHTTYEYRLGHIWAGLLPWKREDVGGSDLEAGG